MRKESEGMKELEELREIIENGAPDMLTPRGKKYWRYYEENVDQLLSQILSWHKKKVVEELPREAQLTDKDKEMWLTEEIIGYNQCLKEIKERFK